MRRWLSAGAVAAALLGAAAGLAQEAAVAPQPVQGATADDNMIVIPSPVLTLDWERLYEGSLWGQRVRADLATASAELTAENQRIADELVKEERALTERRPTMDPEAFRAEADAFDTRVVGIRAAQEDKARALSRRVEDERNAFVEAAVPLLDNVLQARGAAVILDRRVIIRGLAQLDVTEELGRLVDAELGDGAAVEKSPANAPTPQEPSASEPTAPATGGETTPPAADGN